MFNAVTIDGFLDPGTCEYLVSVASNTNLWESGGNEFWANRVLNYHILKEYDKRAASILLNANKRCGNVIKVNYNLENIYSDTLQIVRWFDGMEQPPHADDMSNTDIEGFDHRAFGSIIYLNDSYEGGHTFYPNFEVAIKPQIGKLAVHPGNPEHLHGVTKVQGGMRYTIASFWTLNKEKAIDWELYK